MSQFINYYLGNVQIVGGVEISNFNLCAAPTIYNVTLTDADTEYSQALPANCKRVSVSIQGGIPTDNFRLAYVTGKVATPVAPYMKVAQDREYYEDGLNLTSKTVYMASSAGGKIAQIICWT